jgi:hypothetical protein
MSFARSSIRSQLAMLRLAGLAQTLASLESLVLVTHRNSSLSLSILPGSVDVNLLTQPKNKF